MRRTLRSAAREWLVRRRRPARRRGAAHPPGVTLLELIVVLVLMGIALAIVAPSLRPPRSPVAAPLDRVLAATRAAAVRRGEALVLEVSADGRYAVTANASGDTIPALAGSLGERAAPRRIDVSPLGTCAPEPVAAFGAWDPLACGEPPDTARP